MQAVEVVELVCTTTLHRLLEQAEQVAVEVGDVDQAMGRTAAQT
jgi:hypothetical protein